MVHEVPKVRSARCTPPVVLVSSTQATTVFLMDIYTTAAGMDDLHGAPPLRPSSAISGRFAYTPMRGASQFTRFPCVLSFMLARQQSAILGSTPR